MITVLPIGAEVVLWGEQKGKVVAVMIEAKDSVSYRVAHWNGGALSFDWIGTDMVTGSISGPPIKIGFDT